jgi:hypothetical protein
MADIIRRVALLAINRKFIEDSFMNILTLYIGTSYGNLQMQIRTIFSSSGIGIDSFKSSREQHVSRYAPSLGKYSY